MTERNVNAIAKLETEARKIVLQIREHRLSVLSTLDPSLHEADMRSTALQRLSAVVLTYVLGLTVIQKHLLHFDWWDQNWGTGLTNDQKMTNASAFYNSISYSAFLSAFSILEALVRQTLLAFDSRACNESTVGYWKVRTYLFQHHIALDHSDYSSLFQLISELRNCIHNQGVYRHAVNKKLIIEHNQTRYTFLNLVPPNFLQPENLLVLLSEMGAVMFDILSDPNVVALDRIEDPSEKLGSHNTAEPI